jgi:hypothetical protein
MSIYTHHFGKDKKEKNDCKVSLLREAFKGTKTTFSFLFYLSGSEHMIREFNEQWEKDYLRKTAETLEDQGQVVRRKSEAE